jgi:hypothetical protein
MKIPVGAVVALCIGALCALLLLVLNGSGGSSRPKVGSTQTSTTTASRTTTAVTKTSTKTVQKTVKTTTTSTTTSTIRAKTMPIEADASQLHNEVSMFLKAYYAVGPNENEQRHIAYLEKLVRSGKIMAKAGLIRSTNLGLNKLAHSPIAEINRLRHRDHLTLKGTVQNNSQIVDPLNTSGNDATVQTSILVHAYTPNGREKIRLLRVVHVASSWHYAHGRWIIEALHAPLIGADGNE